MLSLAKNHVMIVEHPFRDHSSYAFTLIELIAVMVIFGILAMLAVPRHYRAREQGYDKKAKAELTVIRSAERQYWIENRSYFPATGTVNNRDAINGNLSLDLRDDGMWQYSIITTSGEFEAHLTRTAGWGYNRYWFINASMMDAACVALSASGCP